MRIYIPLKEIIDKYKPYGANDLDIIKLFFIDNHCEDEAIKMLGELVEERTKLLNKKVSFFKEDLISCQSILFNNDVSEEDKRTLFTLATKFTYHSDLTDEDLEVIKDIFSKNEGKIKLCPVYFVCYLKNKGIELPGYYFAEYHEEMLERIIERRDDGKKNEI